MLFHEVCLSRDPGGYSPSLGSRYSQGCSLWMWESWGSLRLAMVLLGELLSAPAHIGTHWR